MKNLFLFAIAIAMLLSCSTLNISTTNLHDLAEYPEGSNIYALPQTRMVFIVTAIKSSFQSGPYHKYAKEMLGIDGAKAFSSTHWEISDIDLRTTNEPDPGHYYSVNDKWGEVGKSEMKNLKKQGVILDLTDNINYHFYGRDSYISGENAFNDCSLLSFYIEKNKNNERFVHDSLFYIPTSQKQLTLKSTRSKAEEAVKFIFKIRKRRFKLVSGQYEVFPQGVALETSIKELNKIEQEYLSLFVGKYTTDTIQKVFSVIPLANEKLQRHTIFRFSEENGFYTSIDAQGDPIILEMVDLDRNEILNQLQFPAESSTYDNMILYRNADNGDVKILHGSHVILEAEVPVFQFGPVVPYYIAPVKKRLF